MQWYKHPLEAGREVLVQEALNKLPKDIGWTSVRLWFEDEKLIGLASKTDFNIIFTDGEWCEAPV